MQMKKLPLVKKKEQSMTCFVVKFYIELINGTLKATQINSVLSDLRSDRTKTLMIITKG